MDGPKPPAKQAEKPYLRIVVSASPGYFRPDDPDAYGMWDEDRLEAWIEATMAQLFAEHGDDLVFAELHLDEDTPHIHVVVAPTYTKMPRKPGRKKSGETDEEFAARKAAAEAAPGVRVVGRASHPELSKKGSFQRLRERMAVAVDHLGIEYGEDRHGRAEAKTTGQWVKEQASEIRRKQAELEARKREIDKKHALNVSEHKAATDQLQADKTSIFKEANLKAKKIREDAEAYASNLAADIDHRAKDIEEREREISCREDAMKAREAAVQVRETSLSRALHAVQGLVAQLAGFLGAELSGRLNADIEVLRQAADQIADEADPDVDPLDDGPGF